MPTALPPGLSLSAFLEREDPSEAFLSHTKLNGRFVIRVAISNLRTEDSDLEMVWRIVRREAAALIASD